MMMVRAMVEYMEVKRPRGSKIKLVRCGECRDSFREDIINELLLEFTSKKSSPGAKLRAEFDQIIKCLSLPLPVRKGLGLPSKVNIRQNDADSSVDTGSTGTKGSGMFR